MPIKDIEYKENTYTLICICLLNKESYIPLHLKTSLIVQFINFFSGSLDLLIYHDLGSYTF